ncbi:hypothetical protein CHH83_20905 [Bacillus sp. 7586-K]|nr:hypothetical protein CHH83_20905 [Bacillus sp. 7586-K]
MAIKIEVQKAYEEVDIADKIYRIDMTDEKMKQHLTTYAKFQKEIKELEKIDASSTSPDEAIKINEKTKELFEEVINLLLGDGSFDEVYEVCGKSTVVLSDVLRQLMENVRNRFDKINEKNKAYYTGK